MQRRRYGALQRAEAALFTNATDDLTPYEDEAGGQPAAVVAQQKGKGTPEMAKGDWEVTTKDTSE